MVHKAISVHETGKKVAIKEVITTHLKKPQIEDLGHEMNILSQLKHPSIVQLYSIYYTQDKIFLVIKICNSSKKNHISYDLYI